MNASRAIHELNKLIDACRVGVESSRIAGKEARDVGLRSLMSGFMTQRGDFAAILQAEVALLDSGTPSVTATVQAEPAGPTGAPSTRDDAAILADCEVGVKATMDAYRGALQHADLPFRLRAIIQRQYQRIDLSRAGMVTLRQRYA